MTAGKQDKQGIHPKDRWKKPLNFRGLVTIEENVRYFLWIFMMADRMESAARW
jgi:hypothetical protein